MTITDDGKGFDSDVLKQNHYSLGLLGMQNRAAVIDYHLEINSGCGKGTTILLSEKD
jgi:nitrate/nitrite-specific signal transduction histidine kinase